VLRVFVSVTVDISVVGVVGRFTFVNGTVEVDPSDPTLVILPTPILLLLVFLDLTPFLPLINTLIAEDDPDPILFRCPLLPVPLLVDALTLRVFLSGATGCRLEEGEADEAVEDNVRVVSGLMATVVLVLAVVLVVESVFADELTAGVVPAFAPVIIVAVIAAASSPGVVVAVRSTIVELELVVVMGFTP